MISEMLLKTDSDEIKIQFPKKEEEKVYKDFSDKIGIEEVWRLSAYSDVQATRGGKEISEIPLNEVTEIIVNSYNRT